MVVDISLETDGVTGYKRLVINTGISKVYPARTDTFSGDNVQNWAFRDGNSLTATALWEVTTVSGGSLVDPVATKRAEIVALLATVDAQYTAAGGAIPNPLPVTGTVSIGNEVEIKNDVGNPIPVTGTITVAAAVGLDRSFNTGSPNINVTPSSTRVALLGVETFADFYLQTLTISEDSNSGSRIEIFLNPTVAGVFTYAAIQNSITTGAVGTAANTAVIGAGTLLYSAQLNKGVTEAVFDLSKLGKVVLGNKIVVCVTAMLNNTRMRASLNWKELS